MSNTTTTADLSPLARLRDAYPDAGTTVSMPFALTRLLANNEKNFTAGPILFTIPVTRAGEETLVAMFVAALDRAVEYTCRMVGDDMTIVGLIITDSVDEPARANLTILPEVTVVGVDATPYREKVLVRLPDGDTVAVDADTILAVSMEH